MATKNFNGHSMVGDLRRVLVCPPENAGWNDTSRVAQSQQLGFQHPPDFAIAREQHQQLCMTLSETGAEVLVLPASDGLTLDAAYAHDSSIATDFGMILMRPGKKNRLSEAAAHREFFTSKEIPILGEIRAPGTTEAGDMVWLDARTLLVGLGYRTNASGIQQLRDLFAEMDERPAP